jgi:putative transposase
MNVHRAYQYRLYPTPAQEAALTWTLDRCRELYNAGLEERRGAYRTGGILINSTIQQRQLPGVKNVRPEYKHIGSQVLQDVLQRLDRAFAGFFRRVKAGQTPGFPRFKSRDRYNSFTFKQTGWSLDSIHRRLYLAGIGNLKVRWSRPLEGTIKTVTVRRDANQWHVCFSCLVDIPDVSPDAAKPAVGIDVGLEHFATLSTGEHIANPRLFRLGQDLLTRRSRTMARKQRGSKRRQKAKLLVAKAHRKVRNQRKDFHHKTAKTLVDGHRLIAVEQLHITNLVRRPAPILATTDAGSSCYAPNGATAKSGLAKSIYDAGWGQFLMILTHKAAEAGVVLVAVNPAGTSQICSGCGAKVPKPLTERWHRCEHCGCFLQRDVNAAFNILRAGQARQAGA